MIRLFKIMIAIAMGLMLFNACGDSHKQETKEMCEKLPMQADGIVRLSKIQVNPDYLDEYMKYAMEVGTISLETAPGVCLCMPWRIRRILATSLY